METELIALEGKVHEVVALCERLRAENQELRTRLAAADEERRRLSARMDAAKQRLEALIGQIPDEQD